MQVHNETIVWQDYGSWGSDIRQLMADIIDEAVVSHFVAEPPEYVVSDDTSWLDKIVLDVGGDRIDVKSNLAERLIDNFQFLRAFHGCCPKDVTSYYQHGLLPLEYGRAEESAKSHFLSEKFPEISETVLLQALEECRSECRGGQIFFEANERFLVDHCGHYLLYGSEYVVAVAATLSRPGRPDYRRTLKGLGVPTVFVCDVPLELISFGVILELAGSMLEVIFERFLNAEYRHPQFGHAFGFSIRKPLDPRFIVGHHHPQMVRDPIM